MPKRRMLHPVRRVHGIAVIAVSLMLVAARPGCRSADPEEGTLPPPLPLSPPWQPSPSEIVHRGSMVKIHAAGRAFVMGDNNYFYDEIASVHVVSFTYDFWMDTTEVTQGEFDQLWAATYGAYDYVPRSAHSQTHPFPCNEGADRPVCNAFWKEAVFFCNARSKRDGYDTVYRWNGWPVDMADDSLVAIDYDKNGYRLPNEAEWEYACRGGTTTRFYWGESDSFSIVDQYEWYQENVPETLIVLPPISIRRQIIQPVARKKPNPYGLYDMAGNVYEHCNDMFDSYPADTQVDPTGQLSSMDIELLSRSVRGGFYNVDAGGLRSAAREGGFSGSTAGIRCVRRD